MKNNLENQDIKTDKPLAMSYEALKAERDALAVENASMRDAIAFATAPDMWIEQHDGMLDYRYSEWYVDVLNAAIVLFSAQPYTSVLVNSNIRHWKTEWIWEKGNATGFLNAKKQPLRAHENILVFYRGMPTYNPQFTDGHPRKTSRRKTVNSEVYGEAVTLTEYDSTRRYPRDVQFFSSDKQKSRYHPTQKPVGLVRYLIETYSNPGDVVLDFTMGSGTAGVACAETGRRFVGIEKELKYVEVAQRRIFGELVEEAQHG